MTAEEQHLANLELRWNKAIENNDVEGMAAYMSEDWAIMGTDGNITNKKQFLDSVRTKALQHSKMDFQTIHVKVTGSSGVVVCKGISEGDFNRQKFSLHEWSTSVYSKIENEWKCVFTFTSRG
jgi:ketosteroid isomerase-like protein